MLRVLLPLRLISEPNARGHWSKRARRAAEQRGIARLAVRPSVASGEVRPPCTVRLVRLGPRTLDDDNLAGACKAARDGIADALGVNDADPRVRWRYAQERGPYGVRVEIEGAP